MATSVKQSASKEDFVRALGLNMEEKAQKEQFSQMWGEVTRYWETHFETDSRQILRPEYAANMAIHKPYKWAHLSPNAIDTAIAVIRSQAGPGSRQLYDRGDSTDSRVHNWVLKWLLWHVCRYRDWRNRKNRSTSASAATASHLGGGPGYGPGPAGGSAGNASVACLQIIPPFHPMTIGQLFLIDSEGRVYYQ